MMTQEENPDKAHKFSGLPKVQNPKAFLLDETQKLWFVQEGHLDVFAVPIDKNGQALSKGSHCFRLGQGEIAFGCPSFPTPGGTYIGLWGIPSADICLQGGRREIFFGENFDFDSMEKIDHWIQTLDRCIGNLFAIPKKYHLLEAEADIPYSKGDFLSAYHMDTVWIQCPTATLWYGTRKSLAIPPGDFFPLSHFSFLRLEEDANINACHTPEISLRDNFGEIMDSYHRRFMELMHINLSEQGRETMETQRTFAQDAKRQVSDTKKVLSSLLGRQKSVFAKTHIAQGPLLQLCEKIFDDWGVALPSSAELKIYPDESLMIILERLGMEFRKVNLRGWDPQKSSSGHIISFKPDGSPVGLFPPHGEKRREYRYLDPTQNIDRRLNKDDIKGCHSIGLMIYPPIPRQINTLTGLLKYLLSGRRQDFKNIFLAVALNGILFALAPILTGKILVDYLPLHKWGHFQVAMLTLMVSSALTVALYFTNSRLYISLNSYVSSYIQSGLWSRLLTFPFSFFQRHPLGEIVDRMNSVSTASLFLNVTFVQALSTMVSAGISLALLFYYNAILAGIITLVTVLLLALDFFLIRKIVALQTEANKSTFKVNNFILQMLNALAKLRVAQREDFALHQWAKKFTRKRTLAHKARILQSSYLTLHAQFLLFCNILLFFFIIQSLGDDAQGRELLLGNYIVFNAALSQFAFSMTQAVMISTIAFNAIPFLEKMKLIIGKSPPPGKSNVRLGTVRGQVRFNNVNFSYPDGAGGRNAILKNISFTVQPGEYVALVGASGSGKSTIVRLLLGLETPDAGSISVDNQGLEFLDINELRRQTGMVLQSGQILPKSVIKNISLHAEYSEEIMSDIHRRAWGAAKRACFDQDIARMPMGMHTWLGQGEGLSGGQRQRLLIARALLKHPRILLFDEATSAMDNITQSNIKNMLDGLNITRIIIAHRLSTITNVNRVIVLHKGEIIEQGSYQGLLKAGGEFAKFANRQLL